MYIIYGDWDGDNILISQPTEWECMLALTDWVLEDDYRKDQLQLYLIKIYEERKDVPTNGHEYYRWLTKLGSKVDLITEVRDLYHYIEGVYIICTEIDLYERHDYRGIFKIKYSVGHGEFSKEIVGNGKE